jgi:deferrochelatase/peroxidase EfeB
VNHAFVTIIADVPVKDIAAIRTSIEALGNPAVPKIAAALDSLAAIHFASLNVFEASAGDRGYLVFEFSGDGTVDELLDRLGDKLGAELDPIFAHADGRGNVPLREFWRGHVVETGQTPFTNPGVNFTGSPGLSVQRIRRERDLALHLTKVLDSIGPRRPALERLEAIRRQLRQDPQWSWALDPEPVASGGTLAIVPDTLARALPVAIRLALPFARDFLWPLAIPAVIAFLIAWWMRDFTGRGLLFALGWALAAALVTALLAAVAALLIFCVFRRREDAEVPIDRPAETGAVAAILRRENYAGQNHLAALSVMKPGWLRRFTLRLSFWATAQLVQRFFRPGYLGDLGTINFARWVMVPGTGDLLFLSNYGGSWESYLEDFITKAHSGLTGIWSNTLGFPKASYLFMDGATDGDRFKRWARRQQIPTAFWYTAYPDITTANIRANAAIRQGLGGVMTEDEAQSWLSLFGSEVRPASALESNEIQSLMFGGLRFLPEGSALLFGLADDRAAAKAWLGEMLPGIRFADGRSWSDATILGLTASALHKFGLPNESVATFPAAFVDGMAAPWRSRLLGDIGESAPQAWRWGKPGDEIDGVLLLYAKTPDELGRLREHVVATLRKHGHALRRNIPFQTLQSTGETASEQWHIKREPFGFVDGISQPVIRGTYKALRDADPIHIVEAGEFILGYPDNRGYMPPGPTLNAIHDPASLLPVTAVARSGFSNNTVNIDRDLGRNGSFLAIRELEQNVDEFLAYCCTEGARLQPFFPPGVRAPPQEFIAAKIVGRWRDGSPLVRYPLYPATDAPVPAHPLSRAGSRAGASPEQSTVQIPIAPGRPGAATGGADTRPKFEPDNDFLFGTEDPQGLRCPLGAHVRRANPRESFNPGSREQIEITNRHRIIRVGRFYEPEPGQRRGLFFMCLNGDIERQFEFVQQTWIGGASFHGLSDERDPLTANRDGADSHTIPTREGPMRLMKLPSFVSTRGGGYFFLPGRRTMEYLASAGAAAEKIDKATITER